MFTNPIYNLFQSNRRRPFIVCALSLVLFFVISANNTSAATDSFIVRTLVGTDTLPPTVPANLSATPVATTQIDLTWDPSTDDVLLSGYHVWKDGTQIATTSGTTYSNTGLTASTTYTYYVTAYDSFFNESASSTNVATTTLSVPITPTAASSGASFGSRLRPLSEEIISIEIIPGKNSVTIRYETEDYIRSVIKWGRTTSYELGSLAEQALSRFHETTIVGLAPDTSYFFTIEGENRIGRYGVMHVGTFTTLAPDDIFPPGNVTQLTARKDGDDVILSWTNPTDSDFSKVRIVRDDTFYPSDIAAGKVIYEGADETVRDRRVPGQNYQYYTVFAYDTLGNISSGAVVKVYLGEGVPPPTNEGDPTRNEINLTFNNDIEFSQEKVRLYAEQGSVRINGAKQLTISIPYDRVPEHLKTILVVIGDSHNQNQEFSFLLRINKDKTAYTGTLAPFGTSGNFPIQVSVFDFKTAQIGYTNGMLTSHIQSLRSEDSGFFGWLTSTIVSIGGSYVVWFIFALIALMFIGRRLMQKEW